MNLNELVAIEYWVYMLCQRDNSLLGIVVLWRYTSKTIIVLGLIALIVNLAETHFKFLICQLKKWGPLLSAIYCCLVLRHSQCWK